MPRNGSGTYTLPQSAFVPGTVISSTAMNSNFSDIALALTDSMAADGQTPFTGSFLISDGSAVNPSYSFTSDDTDGIFHPGSGVLGIALAGLQAFEFAAPDATTGGGITGLNGAILTPIGIVQDFAGSSAPSGWFLCYGQAISRTTYVELFGVIGTTYGSGNGTTTYNLPDLRGRVVAGVDDMGGSDANRLGVVFTATTLGNSGGDQTIALTEGQLATHSHTFSGTTGTENVNHHHTFGVSGSSTAGGGNGVPNGSDTGSPTRNTSGASTNHTHTYSGTTDDDGSGDDHNNVQPTMVMNKIIFAGHP